MKIGINSLVWKSPFGDGDMDLIPKAKSFGYDIFEICLEDLDFDVAKAARICKENGMQIGFSGAFGETRDVSSQDEQVRENGKNYIRQCVQIAADAGCRIFAGPVFSAVGKARRLPPDERRCEWDRSVSSLRQLAPFCRDMGVTVAIEPLNRFETDMVNTVDQAIQMLDDIGEGGFGVLMDIFHSNIEEKSIPGAIRKLGKDRLTHVHACENDRGTPGSGHQDWDGMMQALVDIGYEGALVLESFTPDCIEIAKAASLWRPLASSQDDMAREGRLFLADLVRRHGQ